MSGTSVSNSSAASSGAKGGNISNPFYGGTINMGGGISESTIYVVGAVAAVFLFMMMRRK